MRTGVLFFAFFIGERRQARGEREARVTRDGRASLVARDLRSVLPSARLKNAKKNNNNNNNNNNNACSAGYREDTVLATRLTYTVHTSF